MGRKSRIKCERREQAAASSKPTRRDFLKWGTTALLVGSVPAARDIFHDGKWDFLEDRPHSAFNDTDVARTYVPLGPETSINRTTAEFAEAKPWFEREIEIEHRKRGLGTSPLTASLTTQEYGVPENARFAEPLLAYCKTATDYLASRLKRLEHGSIDWVVIKNGDKYEQNMQKKGFIGHSYFEVQRVLVTGTNDPSINFTLGRSRHMGSASVYKLNTSGNRILWWYVFIASGPHSIFAPFSEVLPVTTSKKSLDYAREAGFDAAWEAEEAVTEGLSYYLAREIADKLKIPNGTKVIEEKKLVGSNPRYKSVPYAIRWIGRNGLQNALDLYMESPKRFMEQISKS